MYFNTMYFKSKLTPDEIQSVLGYRTRPWVRENILSAGVYISRVNKDDFYLMKTSKYGRNGGLQVPFIGKVFDQDNYTLIAGKFSSARETRRAIAIFQGIGSIPLLFSLCKGVFDAFGTAFLIVGLCLWFYWGYCIFEYCPRPFFKKEKADVVEFILNFFEAEQIEKEDLPQTIR